MDKRRIIKEKEKTLLRNLNSDEMNLELASKIDELHNLKEIIKVKSSQSYISDHEKARLVHKNY